MDGVSTEYMYGWCGWRPGWLQGLNTAGCFVFFMFLGNTFQSLAANGLVGVVTSTLERRFSLSSTASSWVAGSAYELSCIPAIMFFSYVGTRIHRPKYTAIGQLLVGLGCLIFVLPHFITDPYQIPGSEGEDNICNAFGVNESRCEDNSGSGDSTTLYLVIFLIGRIIMAFGSECLYKAAMTYLDDSVPKNKFSLYIAIFLVGGIVGPSLAFICGGLLLNVYTDFYNTDTSEIRIDSSDPRWVGAWWIGFLVSAVILVFVALPFAGYPRDLPGAAEVRAAKKSEAYAADTPSEGEQADEGIDFKKFPSYMRDLVKNPTYLALVGYNVCDTMMIAGFSAFGPKYIETQFSLSPAMAGLLMGVIVIPGGTIGLLMGGFLIDRFKMTCPQIVRTESLFALITMGCAGMFIIQCDSKLFAGVNVEYNVSVPIKFEENFSHPCNLGCGCVDVEFTPVCGVNNVQYYSPCHAGCLDVVDVGDIKEYYNCSCLVPGLGFPPGDDGLTDELGATTETCTVGDCALLPLVMVLFFIAIVMLFACEGMTVSAMIRSVPGTHRSLGIGAFSITHRILGGTPGPLLFGVVFDQACSLWNETCGSQGACTVYDLESLSLMMLALAASVKGLSLIFMTVAWLSYKPPSTQSDITLEVKASETTGTGTDISSKVPLPQDAGHINNGIVYTDDTIKLQNTTKL